MTDAKGEAKGGSNTEALAVIKRGSESWNYYYIVLGFALAIEGTLIQILDVGRFWGIATYIVLASLTVCWFINSGWLHNKLTQFKSKYENKFRSPE